MTSKPQCPTCGAKMIPAFTRQGLELQICPNRETSNVKRIGPLRTAEIPCPDNATEYINAVTRQGLRLRICANLKDVKAVRRLSGSLRYIEIPCRNISGLQAAFEQLTQDTDITIEALRKVTHETVNTAKLLENANLAVMLGLPKDQLIELFKCAYKLGLAVGIKPHRGIEALCKGVGRRSRLILDNIGITFKPTDAYEWYKSQNGLDTLTTPEKSRAWQHYAIHQIRVKAEAI